MEDKKDDAGGTHAGNHVDVEQPAPLLAAGSGRGLSLTGEGDEAPPHAAGAAGDAQLPQPALNLQLNPVVHGGTMSSEGFGLVALSKSFSKRSMPRTDMGDSTSEKSTDSRRPRSIRMPFGRPSLPSLPRVSDIGKLLQPSLPETSIEDMAPENLRLRIAQAEPDAADFDINSPRPASPAGEAAILEVVGEDGESSEEPSDDGTAAGPLDGEPQDDEPNLSPTLSWGYFPEGDDDGANISALASEYEGLQVDNERVLLQSWLLSKNDAKDRLFSCTLGFSWTSQKYILTDGWITVVSESMLFRYKLAVGGLTVAEPEFLREPDPCYFIVRIKAVQTPLPPVAPFERTGRELHLRAATPAIKYTWMSFLAAQGKRHTRYVDVVDEQGVFINLHFAAKCGPSVVPGQAAMPRRSITERAMRALSLNSMSDISAESGGEDKCRDPVTIFLRLTESALVKAEYIVNALDINPALISAIASILENIQQEHISLHDFGHLDPWATPEGEIWEEAFTEVPSDARFAATSEHDVLALAEIVGADVPFAAPR